MAKTIVIKGGFIRKEGVAGSAVTPGHLIEGFATIDPHSVAGGNARKAFALENDLVGDGIEDAYDAGDTVLYGVFDRGAEVQALLAYGETTLEGSPLESAGDGTLQVHASEGPVDAIVAYAKVALANTAGGAAARITVEVA